jgi:hypothetical protein
MKKLTLTFLSVLILCGLFFTFPITNAYFESSKTKSYLVTANPPAPMAVVVPRRTSGTTTNFASDKNLPPTATEVEFYSKGKDKKAQRIAAFQTFRNLLLQQGVPFEPNILLQTNWKEILQESNPDFFSSKASIRLSDGKMKGALIADSIYLTSKTEFTGDTIILARRLVFEGKDVLLKGNHNIAIFPIEETLLTESISGKNKSKEYKFSADSPEFEQEFFSKNRVLKHTEEVLKSVNGRIVVDASAGKSKGNFIGRPCTNGGGNCSIKRAGTITVDATGRGNKEWRENQIKRINGQLSSLVDDRSGSVGADGSYPENPVGSSGAHGQNGTAGGQDGSCIGGTNDANGKAGEDGSEGVEGDRGDNAGDNAVQGGTGGDIVASVDGTENDFTFISRGGAGGNGRDGAVGGTGGNGGIGVKGGNGVTCGCFVGSGGKSGDNKKGGDAGSGGKGGNAARGGTGGSITITYPVGFEPAQIVTINDGGDPGTPGRAGSAGQPGSGTPGQNGGNAGSSNCGAFGTSGGFGTSGLTGSVSNAALAGNTATQGDAGPAPVLLQSGGGCLLGCGGGGPTFCELYPQNCNGGGGNGCTPWYYVYYLSWDGGLTWEEQFSIYIGCW